MFVEPTMFSTPSGMTCWLISDVDGMGFSAADGEFKAVIAGRTKRTTFPAFFFIPQAASPASKPIAHGVPVPPREFHG